MKTSSPATAMRGMNRGRGQPVPPPLSPLHVSGSARNKQKKNQNKSSLLFVYTRISIADIVYADVHGRSRPMGNL